MGELVIVGLLGLSLVALAIWDSRRPLDEFAFWRNR